MEEKNVCATILRWMHSVKERRVQRSDILLSNERYTRNQGMNGNEKENSLVELIRVKKSHNYIV